MLTFKHAFNSKNSSSYLGSCHGKPFFLPLISNKLLSECVMVREWGINEFFSCFPKFSSKCKCVCGCRECSPREEKRLLSKMHTHLYIYYTLHILFGRLDLMGQSNELGWAHKKSSNNMCPVPLWTTMQKNKLTLIYDIIKLIM